MQNAYPPAPEIAPVQGRGRSSNARLRWPARVVAGLGLVLALTACVSVLNEPLNEPIARASEQRNWPLAADQFGSTVVGLAFSGGGMRASAFSYGVLQELDRHHFQTGSGPRPLTEAVAVVSGVSGGSVTAAYFGLKGREGLQDFRTRFLDRDAEQGFDTQVSLGNVLKIASNGGVNDASRFPRWLDDNLFGGATYADLFARGRPLVWITASDVYSRVPFVFDPVTFSAICSDLSKIRLSDAVAASAAVPGLFIPINVENFGSACGSRLPKFMQRGLADSEAPATLHASALALNRYREDPERFRYVKLLDGGLTDNFGIHSLTLARSERDRPHVPFTAEQGARVNRFMFLVVDAGRGPSGDWTRTLAPPSGLELADAVTSASIDASVYKGYDYFKLLMKTWEADLRRWRCSLPLSEVARLRGTSAGWNCNDVSFTVERVSFDDAGAEMKPFLDQVPTRLRLSPQTVDKVVEGGELALRNNAAFRNFLRRIPGSGRAAGL